MRFLRLLGLWHLTSVDAPTVAVVWMLAFAKAARVSLPLWVPVGLASAAWSFYIGDRLLDARAAKTPLRSRHHFHWRNRRIFFPIAIMAAIVAITLVLYSMPIAARERNSVLAAAALAYLGTVHSPWRPASLQLRMPKELLVGILFTLACATPVWTRMPSHRIAVSLPDIILPVLIFIALAWLNCQAIETWESPPTVPRAPVRRLALALGMVAALGACILGGLHYPIPAALLASAATSAALLGLLDRLQQRLSPITTRAAADLVLLVPLAVLALS
jgi:hypothetical protein